MRSGMDRAKLNTVGNMPIVNAVSSFPFAPFVSLAASEEKGKAAPTPLHSASKLQKVSHEFHSKLTSLLRILAHAVSTMSHSTIFIL